MKLIITKITPSTKHDNLSLLSMAIRKSTPFGEATTSVYMWVENTTVTVDQEITVDAADYTIVQKEAIIEGETRLLNYLKLSVL